MRFLIDAELLCALSTFGGLAAGVNLLSIGLNLETTDTISDALAYDRPVKNYLEEKARARSETT